MKVIGAGFGRTGTMSLKLALDQLGFGPTLHNSELTKGGPDITAAWCFKANEMIMAAAGQGRVPWSALLNGYQSAVDWPVAYYWRELAAEYPQAKIILTHRPVREWLRSFKATIMPRLIRGIMSGQFEMDCQRIVIGGLTFRDDFSDENLMRAYAKHVIDVRAGIDPDRLLEFNIKDGWGPLCKFLGVAIPDESFPVTNPTEEFCADVEIRQAALAAAGTDRPVVNELR